MGLHFYESNHRGQEAVGRAFSPPHVFYCMVAVSERHTIIILIRRIFLKLPLTAAQADPSSSWARGPPSLLQAPCENLRRIAPANPALRRYYYSAQCRESVIVPLFPTQSHVVSCAASAIHWFVLCFCVGKRTSGVDTRFVHYEVLLL